MNCLDHNDERLNDFVDGSLDEHARRDVERHLETCAACRADRDRLVQLLAAARALPRGHRPARDLLPEIRAAVRQGAVARGPGSGSFGARVAVAAGLALAAGLAIGFGVLWSPPPNGPGAGAESTTAFRAAERQYLQANAELLAALRNKSDRLPSETVVVLDTNLAILDRAIEQAQQALKAEPTNPRTGRALTTLYRRKLDLLWTASRFSS